jgi:hypothetical protein
LAVHLRRAPDLHASIADNITEHLSLHHLPVAVTAVQSAFIASNMASPNAAVSQSAVAVGLEDLRKSESS